jgi:Tol biopolymer transport system component
MIKTSNFRAMAAMLAAILAASVLALVAAVERAEAAFPGTAGAIAFDRSANGTIDIYRMNADGFGQTKLTDAPGFNTEADWSADGTKIAFVNQSGTSDIWTMEADGSGETDVSNAPGGFDTQPAWFPNGKKIAFVSNRDGGTKDVYALTLNASGQPIETTRLTSFRDDLQGISVSPSGKKIAFARNGVIYVMNAAPVSATNRPKKLTDDPMSNSFGPDWSPSGKKITFTSARTGDREVFTMNADGTRETNITKDAATDDQGPAYSPDTKKIVFRRNFSEIWRMRADGSSAVQLTTGSGDGNPSWQPLP